MDVPASKRKLYKGMNISYLSNRMKPLLPLLLIALFPGLCAAAKTAEPAGSSFEKAVVIAGAKSSMDGVPAERKWLKKKYGNYESSSRRSSRKEASIMTWSRSGRKKARSWSSISIFPDSSIVKNRGGRSFATLDGVPSPAVCPVVPVF